MKAFISFLNMFVFGLWCFVKRLYKPFNLDYNNQYIYRSTRTYINSLAIFVGFFYNYSWFFNKICSLNFVKSCTFSTWLRIFVTNRKVEAIKSYRLCAWSEEIKITEYEYSWVLFLLLKRNVVIVLLKQLKLKLKRILAHV